VQKGNEARAPKLLHVGRTRLRERKRSRVEELASGLENIVQQCGRDMQTLFDAPMRRFRHARDGRKAVSREEDAMTEILERPFAAIGARLQVAGAARGAPRIDVRSDRRGVLRHPLRRLGRSHRQLAPRSEEHGASLAGDAARHLHRLTAPPRRDCPRRGLSRAFRDRLTGRTPRSERGDRGSNPCPGAPTGASSSAG
jgi:hypothetical protein